MNLTQYKDNPALGFHRLKEWILDKSIQKGILRGTNAYKPFIILGYYRTGSNYLQSLLNSLPSVVTYSEVFFNDKIFWANGVYGKKIEDPVLLEDRLRDPVQFLNDHIYRPYPGHIQAVGFKYLYPQFEDKRFAAVASHLQDMPELKVIHLKRKNYLRTQLSLFLLLNQTGVAVATDDRTAKSLKAVSLDPEKLEQQFQALTQRSAEAEAFFQGHPMMQVEYEDFEHDPDRVLKELCTFLDIPFVKPFSALRKLNPKPLSESILNYQELKSHFQGSPWEDFFEE